MSGRSGEPSGTLTRAQRGVFLPDPGPDPPPDPDCLLASSSRFLVCLIEESGAGEGPGSGSGPLASGSRHLPSVAVLDVQRLRVVAPAGRRCRLEDERAGEQVRVAHQDVRVVGEMEVHQQIDLLTHRRAGAPRRVAAEGCAVGAVQGVARTIQIEIVELCLAGDPLLRPEGQIGADVVDVLPTYIV